jgi:hypothetical protein
MRSGVRIRMYEMANPSRVEAQNSGVGRARTPWRFAALRASLG